MVAPTMPRRRHRVQYVARVHALLVASGAVIGVAAGALLDPVGQRLADRSRAADERRRAAREAERAAGSAAGDGDATGGPATVPELDEVRPVTVPDLPSPQEPVAAPGPAPVRHLLPAGRSTARTVGAALVTGALVAAAAVRFGPHLVLVPYGVFLAVAVTASVTDLTHRLVPRQLIFASLAVVVPLFVVVSAQDHHWRPLVDAAVAGAAAFAVFFLIWFFVPKGMGFGDVRLAGAIGVAVGYLDLLHAYVAFLSGFVLGLLFGVVLMVGSPAGRRTLIPFAPALCAGAVIGILWGDPIVHHVFGA
jgi:leader peptidase (prepilin peptidase) / N-methyltransferase